MRIGLIGALGEQNVWALFSGEGYSYNNYALRARYWPRLFEFSVPEQSFEPLLAAGMPTPVLLEGAFHTATVPIRTDVLWTDGSAFTAQDVAFTINAALEFELGFDWGDFYDGEVLDHAEAASADTVKFFFKTQPGLQAWQLGALHGPVVQSEYWAPKVAAAADALPTAESRDRIVALQSRTATLQDVVNGLYAQTLTAVGPQARELQADLRRQQGNLDEATNDLAAEQAALQDALKAARLELFQQDDGREPLLGPWLPAETSGSASGILNLPNPSYPGPRANFDQASYVLFASPEEARRALAAGEINLILNPAADASNTSEAAMVSPSRSLRLLVLNQDALGLSEPALRQALACVLDQAALAAVLSSAVPAQSVIPSQDVAWFNAEATLPCAGMDSVQRLERAVGGLRSAGFTWEIEPVDGRSGQGLRLPDGSDLPALRLLAPSSDPERVAAAAFIEEAAATLGIRFTPQIVSPDALDYAVLSSGDFDAALLGWRVPEYPGFMCEWFEADRVFNYSPSLLPSLCGQLNVSSDLENARDEVLAIQEALVMEVPLIPLFRVALREEMQGVAYPFESLVGGLVGVYGAPELALPTAR